MRGIMFVLALLALSMSVFAFDLIVNNIYYYPQNPTPGSLIPVIVEVMNIGNSTANSSMTGLVVDGALYGARMVGPIQPMQAAYANFTYNVTASPNPHTLAGVADYFKAISETNENNNQKVVYLTVTIPIYCGDGICNGNETYYSCPSDCPPPIYCGDGICNGNETCSTCPGDCGLCPNCTPQWYCKNPNTRAYKSSTCQVTYFPCGNNYCCNNGKCIKDLSNKCRNVQISYADDALAQMKGAQLQLSALASLLLAALVGIVLYSFMKMESHL